MGSHRMTDAERDTLLSRVEARTPVVETRVQRLQRKLVGFDVFYGVIPYWPSQHMEGDPCAYCGKYRRNMDWDHLDARYDGHGRAANLARSCWVCNRIKNRRTVLRYLRDKAERYFKLPLVPPPLDPPTR